MFNDLFNSNDFLNFEKLFKQIKEKTKDYDWDLLKTLGTVEVKEETKEGFVTTTRSYTSNDGKTSILVSSSVPEVDSVSLKVKIINEAIRKAVQDENYMKAAELKTEKDKFLINGR